MPARQAADARHRARRARRCGPACRSRKPARRRRRSSVRAARVQVRRETAGAAREPAAVRRTEQQRSRGCARANLGQQRRALVHGAAAERADDGCLPRIDRAAREGARHQPLASSTSASSRSSARVRSLPLRSGNATRDAGILHLRYRPGRAAAPSLALVGKGVVFDTGGTNLKPFLGMLDMHTDMQGSAVALGTLLALARAARSVRDRRVARDHRKPARQPTRTSRKTW